MADDKPQAGQQQVAITLDDEGVRGSLRELVPRFQYARGGHPRPLPEPEPHGAGQCHVKGLAARDLKPLHRETPRRTSRCHGAAS